ncbi:uncharacterized protein LOC134189250 [Corticium candelabrum]|uniref:uncharacterized protein LOC134189250 n=1 Tax=Corticium candelabrum TaxID=121492 RepID=UPI002E25296C|nr:uncharacterized protein LOC134189250 [Corticium candelabrum]
MTVPPGAVQSPTLFSIHSFIHNKYMPPVSASGDQVVSPVVFLGPHDVSFSKPINVRINSIADVTSPGWLLTLMRSESSLDETKQRWHSVVEYSTDTQELKSHIPFDANSWSFEVSKLSWWMWIARFIKNPTIPFRRKMGCVVLGRSLSHSSCKWALSVHMFNSYEEIGQEIIKSHRAHETLPAVKLCPVTEFIVRKEGHVVITPQHGSEWSLCRRDVQLQCPTEYLWRKAFNHDHCFTFVIEANDSRPDSLEVPVRVEYIRQGQVESDETLQAVYKLLHTTRAIDLSRTSVPSNFPSLSLSDEERESFYFCGTNGLHSSRLVSSPMAARDGALSQRSIVKQPADVHTVRQCVVSPSYSRAREHAPLVVRLPVGSEVPSTVCTFRYIRPTGQTVTETPGERVDSQTVQTITPAWPHADRVEMAMLSSDGQSRLAYLVHDFVDMPAADPESPHTSMKRDDDSTVAVASQGPNKERGELDMQSIVSDVQLLEVNAVRISDVRFSQINDNVVNESWIVCCRLVRLSEDIGTRLAFSWEWTWKNCLTVKIPDSVTLETRIVLYTSSHSGRNE